MGFEIATRNAMKAILPDLNVEGCFFPFHPVCLEESTGLCNTKRIQNLKLVRRAAVLPLVPADQVEDVWFNALSMNENDTPSPFYHYITETWVDSQRIQL